MTWPGKPGVGIPTPGDGGGGTWAASRGYSRYSATSWHPAARLTPPAAHHPQHSRDGPCPTPFHRNPLCNQVVTVPPSSSGVTLSLSQPNHFCGIFPKDCDRCLYHEEPRYNSPAPGMGFPGADVCHWALALSRGLRIFAQAKSPLADLA
jgi:hypothetical protein